jgi:hypothetical protein
MQSHEQRKQVVARGLLHLLHARLLDTGRPLELPGGIPADERMDIPVPTRGTIPDADMVEISCQWIATKEEIATTPNLAFKSNGVKMTARKRACFSAVDM